MTPVEALAEKLTKWYCEANYPVHGKWIGKMINDLSQYLSDHAGEFFEEHHLKALREQREDIVKELEEIKGTGVNMIWQGAVDNLITKLKGEIKNDNTRKNND